MKAVVRYPIILGVFLCTCLVLVLHGVYIGGSSSNVPDISSDPEVRIIDGALYHVNRRYVGTTSDPNSALQLRPVAVKVGAVSVVTTVRHGQYKKMITTIWPVNDNEGYKELLLRPVRAKPAIVAKTPRPQKLWKPESDIGLNLLSSEGNRDGIEAKLGIPGLKSQANIIRTYASPETEIKVLEEIDSSSLKQKDEHTILKKYLNKSSQKEAFKSQTCDMIKLRQNDTDVHNVVDVCDFPVISNSPSVEKKINKLLPIHLPLLPNYKSPCWYESLSSKFKLEYRPKYHMFPEQALTSFSKMTPILDKRVSELRKPWRLRCLPLVYIIGVAKCGTSDLFETLVTHPHIASGATKEPFFWDWGRWKTTYRNTLTNYLNLYDEAAESIRKLTVAKTDNGTQVAYHPMVTIDASVNTLFEFGGTNVLPGNARHSEPKYIAAHMIRNLTPRSDVKVILIIRNPTERLFTSYLFFNTVTHPSNISREEFHALASNHISRLNSCFRKRPLTSCLYDEKVTRTYKTVDVHAGVYYGFVKDWLAVFPEMKVLRLEDYRANRYDVYTSMVRYIGLEPSYSEVAISDHIVGKGPKKQFTMMPRTKKMLDDFYRPFNKQLADILRDKNFLFER